MITPETREPAELLWLGTCPCGDQYSIPDAALRQSYPHLSDEFDEGAFTTDCPGCGDEVDLYRRSVQVVPFEAWKVMPPSQGCPDCGRGHEEWMPHDLQMLVYQYQFRSQHGRWPTWHDAMAHCTEEVKRDWIEGLKHHGLVVPPLSSSEPTE